MAGLGAAVVALVALNDAMERELAWTRVAVSRGSPKDGP